MKFGLDDQVIEKIQGVFRAFPAISSVYIYGSRAKGNYREGSGIDLCIKNSSLSQQELNRVSSVLDDLNLPYTFDLSVYESLSNPDFVSHIDRVGVEFYTVQR